MPFTCHNHVECVQIHSINQALRAIRKLAAGVERVKGVKQEGVRAGNWLTRDEAERLVNVPVRRWQQEELPRTKALRDSAILAVMVGTGLRRAEAAGLTWEQIQQRDGRWAIIDLVGKRNRVRSVGIPSWVKVALDRWAAAVGVYEGQVFRTLSKDGGLAGRVRTKGGSYTDGNLSPQAT